MPRSEFFGRLVLRKQLIQVFLSYMIRKLMPHISSKKLSDKHFEMLYEQLVGLVSQSGKSVTWSMLNQFLTRTEKIMFAKRLAVISMLSKGLSSYDISNTLHMSPATVARMSLKYEENKYNQIIKMLMRNKASTVVDVIEAILSPAPSGRAKARRRIIDEPRD